MSRTKYQQTDNRKQAVGLEEKTREMVSIVRGKELSITAIKEAWKEANSQINSLRSKRFCAV